MTDRFTARYPLNNSTLTLIVFFLLSWSILPVFGQDIQRIDPPNWWVGMDNPKVQLLVYGKNIGKADVKLKPYPFVKLAGTQKVSNPNYLFIDLVIAKEAAPGTLNFSLKGKGVKAKFKYELQQRGGNDGRIQGLDGSDVIYLIMPDRFANGNPENDHWEEAAEKELNRDSLRSRHGGDLQGIQDHLDYIDDLGMTAIWINPLIENNNPEESFHGYAFTDHYRTDPRLCTNEEYRDFVDACHEKGMKVVNDVVYNHIGKSHWFYQDLPDSSWFNWHDGFVQTSYRAPTLLDPYASEADRFKMTDGWFVEHMPDLNQRDPLLARYLIQNSVWWVEYSGLDAYRIDTYAYPDQRFMSILCKNLRKEFPNLFIFGETWVHGSPIQSFFTEENFMNPEFSSNMQGVTDFQLHYAVNHALTNNFGWTEGLARIYYTLAKDGIYKNAANNVTFLDNHDISRFMHVVGDDLDKFKMGIGFLLTTRGIPQLYYGTEILMNGTTSPNDGMVRKDFPGGWAGDEINKFTEKGRTARENEAFNFISRLANYRQRSTAIQTGKLMQFVPEKGIYTYFRYDESSTVMVIMNQEDKPQTVKTDRFAERLTGFSKAEDIFTGDQYPLGSLDVPAKGILVLELK